MLCFCSLVLLLLKALDVFGQAGGIQLSLGWRFPLGKIQWVLTPCMAVINSGFLDSQFHDTGALGVIFRLFLLINLSFPSAWYPFYFLHNIPSSADRLFVGTSLWLSLWIKLRNRHGGWGRIFRKCSVIQRLLITVGYYW